MKRFSIAAAIAATASLASLADANTQPADTMLNVTGAGSVIITESPSGMKVTVKGNENDPDYVSVFEESYSDDRIISSRQWYNSLNVLTRHRDNQAGHWDLISGGVSIGWTSALGAPDDMNLQMSKSWEITWLDMVGLRYNVSRLSGFSVGFGMNWRNFKIADGSARFYSNAGNIAYGPFQPDVTPVNSRLKLTTIGFNFKWEQLLPFKYPWGGRPGFTAGVILNYTTHASLKTRWINDKGNSVEQYDGHSLNYRRFTVDLYGQLNLSSLLGLYVRYCPMTMLRGGDSPEFRSLSTGIVFFM